MFLGELAVGPHRLEMQNSLIQLTYQSTYIIPKQLPRGTSHTPTTDISLLLSYLHKIGEDKHPSTLCPLCKTEPYTPTHLFKLHQSGTTQCHGFMEGGLRRLLAEWRGTTIQLVGLDERVVATTNPCACCSPSETYGRKGGDSNFQFFADLPVPPQVDIVVGTLIIVLFFLCNSGVLSTIISFFRTLKDVILFLQYVHFHYFACTLCMHVMCLTSLTGSFDNRRS